MKRRKQQPSTFYIGFHVREIDAETITRRLDVRVGNGWTWERDGLCTKFTAPRKLGAERYAVARAYLDGYTLGAIG